MLTGGAQASPVGAHTPVKNPTRIVSTNLCADAYVLALAEPGSIAALSWQADSKMSAAPTALRHKNLGFANAERLAALKPDIIVLGPGDAVRTARASQKNGTALVSMQWAESFAGIYENLQTLGHALGRQQQAKAQIATIKTQLNAIKTRANTPPLRVLYLTPNGNSAGENVFVDRAILAAGGINHGATLGIKGWGRVPLEKLALNPPDLVIQSFFDNGYPSVSNLRRHHPLLARTLKDIPLINIAGGDWVCAGPRLINATKAIADALLRLATNP